MEQCVYVIQMGNDGPIKIGIAIDPRERIAQLQIGNPMPLKIVASFSGGLALERELHRRLADYRMVGEWFESTPEVWAAIHAEVMRVGRTSPALPRGHWGYKRCANCDVLLKDKRGYVEQLPPTADPDPSPRLCYACVEFIHLRASGVDPFAEDPSEASVD